MLPFKSSLWPSLKDFWKKRGKFNSNPKLGLSCNDVYVTRAGLITEGDKGRIYPLLHSFKMQVSTCITCVCVCFLSSASDSAQSPSRLTGTSQETLRIRAISCVTLVQMWSNKWKCKQVHECLFRPKWRKGTKWQTHEGLSDTKTLQRFIIAVWIILFFTATL